MPQTGATRYQKFLKSDKAKTKLKSKNKELPKGTNVTKTNFKIKKIIVREQLKKHNINEALSARKLSVKELISRLGHFNVQSRTGALNELKELVEACPEVLEKNLGPIIIGIAPLLLNIEKVIRRETLSVLHMVLSKAVPESIEPFNNLMSTYLRSAMTHIDMRIQEDSLLFLDILLETNKSIALEFHKIIPNFLDMISKLRIDSKPGRTLTVNLDSHVTTLKWRIKVLDRLQKFLIKFTSLGIGNQQSIKCKKLINFNNGKFDHFGLFDSNYTSNNQLTCFTSNNQNVLVQSNETEQFQKYIETLMPLLFETWLEVCPNSNKGESLETVITEDTALLLTNIIEVISLLWHIVVYLNKRNPSSNIDCWFTKKYKLPFSQQIFKAFPYVTNLRSKKNNPNTSGAFTETITDPKLTSQNLEICNIFVIMNPNFNIKSQSSEINSVINYLTRMLNKPSQNGYNIILKVLNNIFTTEVNSWSKNYTIIDSLMKSIIETYFSTDSSYLKEIIFSLLCKIAVNERYSNSLNKNVCFEKWLSSLPDILLQGTVTLNTINVLHMYAVKQNKQFNNIVKTKLVNVVRNLPNIRISDANDCTAFLKLYSLLFWIKSWDNETLNLLESQLLNNEYKEHSKYIFDTLKLRSEGIWS